MDPTERSRRAGGSPGFSRLLGEELLLQLKDRRPSGGALDAAERNGAVSFLSFGVHVQQGAGHAHIRGQNHVQVLGRLLSRVMAQGVAFVASSQQCPGVRLGPEGHGSRSGDGLPDRGLLWCDLLLLLLLCGWRSQGGRTVGWKNTETQTG